MTGVWLAVVILAAASAGACLGVFIGCVCAVWARAESEYVVMGLLDE